MTVKTFSKRAGFFIVSEANKTRSRATITVKQGEVLAAGSVIGLQASTQKYIGYQNDETAISASAILFDDVDATAGDVQAVAIVRDAEVHGDELVWDDTEDTGDKEAAYVDLATHGIIVRFEDRVT